LWGVEDAEESAAAFDVLAFEVVRPKHALDDVGTLERFTELV
jgi:hypothetical protein